MPAVVVRAQLSVALCDLDPLSFDLDFDQLTQMADSTVLCVLATHLLGIGVDVPRIVELCRQRGIFVVEDVAQAFGGDREGRPFGSMGDVSFLSFGRGKTLAVAPEEPFLRIMIGSAKPSLVSILNSLKNRCSAC